MKKLGFIVVTFIILLLAGCGGPNYKKLEADFISVASDMYEKDIRGTVIYSGTSNSSQLISLELLEKAKVDITKFTDANCDKTSYVKITENKVDENGKPVENYKTEVFLTCGSYKSTNK